MKPKRDFSQDLIKQFLPPEIFKYFSIIDVQVTELNINVHLDELNIIPTEYSKEKLISHGFHSASIIQDFPIRNKSVYLHVRRRRWLMPDSNTVISRDWDAVAKGTRFTTEFASFLKGLFGYLPDQQ